MKSLILSSGLLGLAMAESLVVGLGSSYSQGPGLAKPIGQILAEKLSTTYGQSYNFSNIAVSGSVLRDVTNSQASKLAAGPKPDVVYLVSGGNDLNYVLCLANPKAEVCKNPIGNAEYKTRYQAALDATVKAIGYDKSTPIYVVEYIQAIDDASRCNPSNAECPLSADDLVVVNGLYDRVTQGTTDALKTWKATGSNADYNVVFIPMREYSAGHRVGSTAPWINGATVPANAGGILWHPDNAGAQAVAQYIYEDLVSREGDDVEC